EEGSLDEQVVGDGSSLVNDDLKNGQQSSSGVDLAGEESATSEDVAPVQNETVDEPVMDEGLAYSAISDEEIESALFGGSVVLGAQSLSAESSTRASSSV
ncbi:MAG: hypothetical protein RR619_11900, partial [Raoultibacter sp.]